MKKTISHKKPILLGVGILAVITTLLVFSTCDIGLGPIVNTEKPVISNGEDGNGPGSFLQGENNKIELNVENKLGFKIDEVFMEVEYIDKNTGELTRKKFPGRVNSETGKWEVDLNTSEMSDGQISAWVTAIDESGNETTSTEITYFVKNKLPQIEMTIPVITTENFDNDDFLKELVGSDPVYRRFSLMGVATDDFGVERGFPKIMIWPSDNTNIDTEGLPRYENGKPTDRYGYWYSLEDIPGPDEKRSTKSTRFSWPMLNLLHKPSSETAAGTFPEGGEYRLPKKNTNENREDYLSIGKYRFRIWTKDLFGNDNFYPNRTDHGTNQSSKKYIEISYKSATSTALADITDCPEFYNLAVPLEIDIILDRGDGSLTLDPVHPVRAKIIKANNNDAAVLWQGYADPVTDANGVRFKLNIPAAEAKTWKEGLPEDNRLYVKAWAVLDDGITEAGPVLGSFFLVDYTPPDLTIDRPTSLMENKGAGTFEDGGSYNIWYPTEPRPKWVTGIVTLGGVPKDPGRSVSAVKKIYYHFGKLNDDKPLTDDARKALYDAVVWKDTGLDTPTPVIDEIGGQWGGTQYSFTWTYKIFPNEFAKDHPTIVQLAADLGYTQYSPGWIYKRTDSAEGITRVRFYLPFYVKVVDNANNYRIVHYTLCVDPLMDEPQIEITQPEVKTQGVKPIVGGTVRVAGTAEDNNWMHTVLMRVKKDPSSPYPAGTNTDNGYYLPPGSDKFYTSATAPAGYPRPDNTDGWFITNIIGDSSMVNWYANINQDKALDPTDATVPVTIDVIAIDCDEGDLSHNTPHIVGPISTLVVDFSKDVPMFSNILIKKESVADRPYTDGIKTTGKFTFSMDVEAVGNINELSVRVNNTTTPVSLVKNNDPVSGISSSWYVSGTSSPNANKVKRTITVTVNSVSSPMINGFTGIAALNAIDYGKTGNMTLEVTAVDDSQNKLTTNFTYNIGIDNLYPTAVIQTPHIAYENAGAGKYYFVAGTAKDYSTGTESVQGLERVLVYFEKATISRTGGNRTVNGSGTFVRPDGTNAQTTDFITWPDVLDHGGSTTTSTSAPNTNSYARFPKITLTTTDAGPPEIKAYKSDAAMVIDYGESGVFNADNDKDGTKGETWNGTTSSREWGARVDFSGAGWADGPYIVHYLVMDQAGNAVHYKNDIYLQNKRPKITGINFGTDINGANDVTDGTGGSLNEYLYSSNIAVDTSATSSIAGVMSPSFRIRGSKFSVKLAYTGGNGNRTVKVAYVAAGASTSAQNMTRGNVYEIVDFGSKTTDFTRYGAPNNLPGTVFVATGPVPLLAGDALTTIGNVIPYTSPAVANGGNPIKTQASTTYNDTVLFNTFPTNGSNAQRWESDKDGTGVILDVNKNKRFFVVKVYDTTLATSGATGPDAELDQLSDALLIKLDIDNVDNKKPTLGLLPFGQEYYVNPSLPPPMNNPAFDAARNPVNLSDADYIKNIGTRTVTEEDGSKTLIKEGYVQYQKDNQGGTGNTYMSGKVKFIGKAEDNQRIGSIWVSITGYSGVGTTAEGTKFQIARPITTGNNINLIEAMPPDANHTDHWAFRVIDDNYLTLDYGHALTWEFMWDSSKVTNIARNNITIEFEVRDAAPNTGDPKNVITNIVPYISEVVTPLSNAFPATPSVFNRSALGGYPVRETDTITIKGFNLGTSGSVTIGGGNLNVSSRDNNAITGTVSNSLSSGALVVTVNGIPSFNNDSAKNKTAAYNKEPNNVNNNILDNSRYVYVWTTGDMFTSGNYGLSGTPPNTVVFANVSNPFMRIDNSSNLLISHGYYGAQSKGRLRVLRNDVVIDLGTAATNRMKYTTVGVGGSKPSFYAAGTDISSLENGNRGFQLGMSNAAGTNSIWRRAAAQTYSDDENYADHGNIFIYNTFNTSDDRFKIPRIAVLNGTAGGNRSSNTNGRDTYLLSYYDSFNSRLEAIYGTVGDDTSGVNNATSTNTVTPAISRGQMGSGQNTYGWAYKFTTQATAVTTVTSTTGSAYTAAGILNNGTPVIAWYDSNAQRLLLSYGTTTGATAANWTANVKEITTGKGSHVDMAVEGNNIHLAYYSNDGGLWYTYIPYGASEPNVSGRSTVRVDTYLSAGTRIMINVRGGIPYISYAHASFMGTKQSVRVAWRLPGSTASDSGSFINNSLTGKWEVMTVPVNRIPNNEDFICNGVPTGGTWSITTPTYNGGNLSQTIVVGYMSDNAYEGAIIKSNITTVPAELAK